MKKCLNCGQSISHAFCSHCGQSTHTDRINPEYFLHDIPHSVFHIDKGFFFTLINLVIRPGKTILSFLKGQRVRYFSPFGYLLILSSLQILFSKVAVHFVVNNEQLKSPGFFEKYLSVLLFLLIPVLATISYLFYKKKGFNFWEHLIVNTFLTAQINFILLTVKLISVFKFYSGKSFSANITLSMVLFIAYFVHAMDRTMNAERFSWRHLFETLFMAFLFALVFLTAFSLAGVITPWWNF